MVLRHMSSMSPEEISEERSLEAVRAAEKEQNERSLISRRICVIRALSNAPYALNGWEREFVGSLVHRTRRTDSRSRLGGELLNLSPRQVVTLDLLAARHIDQSTIDELMRALAREH